MMLRTSATDRAASMRDRKDASGVHACSGDRVLVHRGREVVAHHASRRAARRVALGRFLQEPMQQLLVALVHLVECAPCAVLRRHRVGVEPAAVHVLVEVVGRRSVRVEQRGIDRARASLMRALLGQGSGIGPQDGHPATTRSHHGLRLGHPAGDSARLPCVGDERDARDDQIPLARCRPVVES